MSVEFEHPDFVILRSRDSDKNAAMATMSRIEDWARGRPYFLMLCVFRDNTPPPAEARSRIHEWTKRVPPHAVAIVGPPFAVRIVIQMVIRAASILQRMEILHHFAANETAARAWLAEQRPVLERRVTQRSSTLGE